MWGVILFTNFYYVNLRSCCTACSPVRKSQLVSAVNNIWKVTKRWVFFDPISHTNFEKIYTAHILFFFSKIHKSRLTVCCFSLVANKG